MTAAPTSRTHEAADFALDTLLAAKGDTTVSVCIPARNEEATVGAIVATIRDRAGGGTGAGRRGHRDRRPLHATAPGAEAAAAGATVVSAAEVLPEHGRGHGKGEALWKSLYASTGEVVVWCDADVRDFDPRFITGLLGPLAHRS